MSCRIIIADDHPMFREGMLRTVQRLLPEATVEQAGDFQTVKALIQTGEEVDTLILDLRFPGLTCMSLLHELRQTLRRTTLIVVSMVDDPAQSILVLKVSFRSRYSINYPSVRNFSVCYA